jgi:pyruvyltransferase
MRSVYYWREAPNFGDQLSPILLAHFADCIAEWAEPADAGVVSTGSVLDMLPQEGWTGIVAGSGKLLWDTNTNLTGAQVLGLRGFLTLEDVKITRRDRRHMVIGDPGLLVRDLVNVERNKYHLGCVPHCTDAELFPRELERSRHGHYPEPMLIDPSGDPLDIIAKIGSCRKIITSSLHGVITADAFGIPRRTEMFPEMKSNRHQGNVFKFLDYGSSIGQAIDFGTLQEADPYRIEKIQYELFDMFQELKGILSVHPALAVQAIQAA